MKKTSKIMSIALAMLMTAGLASCGSSDDKGNDGSKAASNSGETVEVKMAVWGSGAADNFNKVQMYSTPVRTRSNFLWKCSPVTTTSS